jgi:glycine/serine hydroxymethyltransferase
MSICYNCQKEGEELVEVLISKNESSLKAFLCSDSCLRAKYREGYKIAPRYFDTGFSEKIRKL